MAESKKVQVSDLAEWGNKCCYFINSANAASVSDAPT